MSLDWFGRPKPRTTRLRRAIGLRQWVRRELDRAGSDIMRVIDLNRRADAAYSELDEGEAALYRRWAFRHPSRP